MATKRAPSPLWHKALEKYREELKGAEEYQAVQSIHTLDELLNSFSAIQNTAPSNYSAMLSMNRVAPRLKFVDDFSAVLALCFGADASLTAAVWGSIRLILSHASSAAETLQDILDMLEELSLTLPRFQVYEQTLPLNRPLQQALLDVYCETICFYARTIHFLRNNPHLVLRKNAWENFKNDFSRTTMRMKRMSSLVENEADSARMRKDETQYKEVLALLQSMKVETNEDVPMRGYNNMPFIANNKFSGRDEILKNISQSLDPGTLSSNLKSVALFGLGGVGKTQIAVEFAYRELNTFDVVLWIAADNAITIGQSFRTIAKSFGQIGDGEDANDTTLAVVKMKRWLATTSEFITAYSNHIPTQQNPTTFSFSTMPMNFRP
jgi:ATP-dependent Clp protease ATP-binding subunit ClpA